MTKLYPLVRSPGSYDLPSEYDTLMNPHFTLRRRISMYVRRIFSQI